MKNPKHEEFIKAVEEFGSRKAIGEWRRCSLYAAYCVLRWERAAFREHLNDADWNLVLALWLVSQSPFNAHYLEETMYYVGDAYNELVHQLEEIEMNRYEDKMGE